MATAPAMYGSRRVRRPRGVLWPAVTMVTGKQRMRAGSLVTGASRPDKVGNASASITKIHWYAALTMQCPAGALVGSVHRSSCFRSHLSWLEEPSCRRPTKSTGTVAMRVSVEGVAASAWKASHELSFKVKQRLRACGSDSRNASGEGTWCFKSVRKSSWDLLSRYSGMLGGRVKQAMLSGSMSHKKLVW